MTSFAIIAILYYTSLQFDHYQEIQGHKEGLTTEVIFFIVNCEGQKEIDYYWEEL